ncbi:hypothetical protein ACWDG1_30905 [Streptomyces sp. NPDC001177]
MPASDASASVSATRDAGRARRGLLLLAAVSLLAGATACDDGGDGGWKAPGKGQAAVLLHDEPSGPPGRQFDGDLDGLTIASDGTAYVLLDGIQRIKGDRTMESLRTSLTDNSSGLVALPDGSLVFGRDHAIQKYDRDQQVSVLAGDPGKVRSSTAPVPKSTSAVGFRFGDDAVAPIGVRPDGSLIVLDGDVVWSLAKGRLTRVYEVPAADRKSRGLESHPTAAVDHNGIVYVVSRPADSTEYSRIADIMAIHTDGTSAPVALPRSVVGMKGRPADLKVSALTADGADGIYVDTADHNGTYVLHLHGGRADLVARAAYDAHGNYRDANCDLKHPVDAKKLPCGLPSSITYGEGKLLLGGNEHYLLQIGTK